MLKSLKNIIHTIALKKNVEFVKENIFVFNYIIVFLIFLLSIFSMFFTLPLNVFSLLIFNISVILIVFFIFQFNADAIRVNIAIFLIIIDIIIIVWLVKLTGGLHSPFWIFFFMPIAVSCFIYNKLLFLISILAPVINYTYFVNCSNYLVDRHIMITGSQVLFFVVFGMMLYKAFGNERRQKQSLERLNEELLDHIEEEKKLTEKIMQQEKMASLGQLVAGIAHELNNPINFIYGNIDHLHNYCIVMCDIIDMYEKGVDDNTIKLFKKEKDFDFIKKDIFPLIDSMKYGASRIREIVLDLREFSYKDAGVKKECNINEMIDKTLNILKNQYKDRINIIKDYNLDELVLCYPSMLSQVIMNILVNAFKAIEGIGEVRIATFKRDSSIIIEITDNGVGIPEDKIGMIFDPFYTTRDVGKGLGLGLYISYQVMQKHGGRIDVESEVGIGSKFSIVLPEG